MGLDTVELLLFVEEEFNIEIADEAVERVETVGDLEKLIVSLVSAGAPVTAVTVGATGQDIARRLRRILVNELAVEPSRIRFDARIVEDLGLN